MANISYIRLLQAVELFSKEHMQVKRFASDFPAQMPNFGTESEKYPILFVSPTDAIFNENVTTFTIDVYCFDIIQKDRTNINTILSDTNLILSDLHRWLLDGEIFGIDIKEQVITVPIDNALLDYAAGWRMTATFDVDTYGVCEIPFINEPVILMEINDVVYTTNLTCDTLADCETFTDAIDNLQNQIDNKASYLEPLFIDSYFGTRLKPIGNTYSGFTYTDSKNGNIGMNIINTNTGDGAIANISVASKTGYSTGMAITSFSSGYFVPYLANQNALLSFEGLKIVASNGASIDMRTGGETFGSETSKLSISNSGTVSIGVQPALDNTTTDILGRKADGTIVRLDKSSISTTQSLQQVTDNGSTTTNSITANGGFFTTWDLGTFQVSSSNLGYQKSQVVDDEDRLVSLNADAQNGFNMGYNNNTNPGSANINVKNNVDFSVTTNVDDVSVLNSVSISATDTQFNKKIKVPEVSFGNNVNLIYNASQSENVSFRFPLKSTGTYSLATTEDISAGATGPTGPAGADGVSISYYKYNARTNIQTAPPANHQIIWNNATQINSTILYIDHLTRDNIDIDVFLALITTGDNLIIQDDNNSNNYQKWLVSGTTTITPNDYISVPVTYVAGGYTFSNGQDIILAPLSIGIQGPQGPQGATGATGSIWYTGSGEPTIPGKYLDYYLDALTSDVYVYSLEDGWVNYINIKGAVGPAGPVGPTGPAGPTLSYTPYRFLSTYATSSATLTETVFANVTIPANTFNINDNIKLIARFLKPASISNMSLRIRINTSNTIEGATQIGLLTITAASTFINFSRTYCLLNNPTPLITGFAFTSSIANDGVASTSVGSSTAFDTTVTNYLFFTIQLGNTSDSITSNLCTIFN